MVAESHYANGNTAEEIARAFEDRANNRRYTREVASESLVDDDWSTSTLRNIPKLLFGDTSLDRSRFWGETAYYNFVQRLMHGPEKERPSWEDFCGGWPIFFRVVEVLQPSFCLFIGVEAANSYSHGLKETGREPVEPEMRTKVSRTFVRRAILETQRGPVELAFVQHAGSYFSWEGWHAYLHAEHPSLMAWLRDEGYATMPGPRL